MRPARLRKRPRLHLPRHGRRRSRQASLRAGAAGEIPTARITWCAGGAPLVSLFSKHDPAKYAPVARRLEIVDSESFGGRVPALIPVDVVDEALERLLIPAT